MFLEQRHKYDLALAVCLGAAVTGCIFLSFFAIPVLSQQSAPAPAAPTGPLVNPLDYMSAEERAHYAIMEPQAYCAELAKYQTAEQIQTEQGAKFAILQPAAFCAEINRHKPPERLRREASAAFAISNPQAFDDQLTKLKSALQLHEEAAAGFAIENPQIPSTP